MDKKLRILIVDDSSADAELIERELVKGSINYISKLAKSKDEYLSALGEFVPDIILCDYNMQHFNAADALEALKTICPAIPFIVVSGTIGEDVGVELMKLGAADYVMKDKLFKLTPAVNRALIENKVRIEHRNAENALRESEERFMGLLHASGDAILLIEDNVFVDCNEATTRMLGYNTREEFLLVHPSRLSPDTQPDGRASLEKAEEMLDIAMDKGYHRFEWVHRRSNGDNLFVEVSLTPISLRGKVIIHCVLRDLTELKKIEELEQTHLNELEIFYKAAVGREEKIVELKNELYRLTQELNELKD